ncbi:MAG: RNA polymerase sigma factor [Planctomycetaceae bacterium]|nr:RNA polymerase sigma factor [Planctomycetaceae bacterium]
MPTTEAEGKLGRREGLPMGQPAAKPSIDWNAELARHERWLRCVIYARLGDRSGVDEVLQEVSLAAVRQQAPIQDATKVGPWLYRLAVTQSLLYRRKLGRKRKLVERYAEKVRPSEGDCRHVDPLDWLLGDERRQLIRKALKQLPPRDAEILLLKYVEDWNYHQIAARLGISHSAVETRLHRARARMRAALTELQVVES